MFPGMQKFTSGLLGDPFFNMGMGLLSSSGPSLDPGQVGIGRGMALGMQNMSRAQQAAMQQQAMRLQQEKFKREGAKYQQQQELLKRQSEAFSGGGGIMGLLSPEDQAKIKAYANVAGPAAAVEAAQGLLFQKPVKPSSAIEQYEFSKAQHLASGGDPAAFPNFDTWNRNNKRSGASKTSVHVGGAQAQSRILSKDEKIKLGLNVNDSWWWDAKGNPKRLDKEDPKRASLSATVASTNDELASAEIAENGGMSSVVSELTGGAHLAKSSISEAWANKSLSPGAQIYVRNAREWIAKLGRFESGAEVPEREFKEAWLQYFPTYGDSPEVIARKRQARAQIERSFPPIGQQSGAPSGESVDTSLPKMTVSTPRVGSPPGAAGSTFETMSTEQLLKSLE